MEESKFNARKPYFDILQDYIQGGSKEELLEDEQRYLDVLYKLNTLQRKYGKENAIAFIQRPPNNIPYRKSRDMYDESMNLFYSDDGISKKAYRNSMYEDMMASNKLVLLLAKSPRDIEVYHDGMMKAFKMKALDEVDPVQIPAALYMKPLKIYSLNPGAISLPMVDRIALADRIDNLEIAEVEKTRIRQEAGVTKVDFLDLYDEQENKVGSEQR